MALDDARRRRSVRDDDSDTPPLQFLEQRRNALRRVVGEEQVNSERARLDIAVRGEPVAERGKEVRCGRLIDAADEAYAGGPVPCAAAATATQERSIPAPAR